jgi:hypothetical protein
MAQIPTPNGLSPFMERQYRSGELPGKKKKDHSIDDYESNLKKAAMLLDLGDLDDLSLVCLKSLGCVAMG